MERSIRQGEYLNGIDEIVVEFARLLNSHQAQLLLVRKFTRLRSKERSRQRKRMGELSKWGLDKLDEFCKKSEFDGIVKREWWSCEEEKKTWIDERVMGVSIDDR